MAEVEELAKQELFEMNQPQFYVYHLIDPRTGDPFYIGKGKGARIDDHEREADRMKRSRKCDRIREIQAAGLRVHKVKVAHFHDETEAYDFETAEIDAIGIGNLTNVVPGGRGGWSGRLEEVRKRVAQREAYQLQELTEWLTGWLQLAESWPHGLTVPGLRNGDEIASRFVDSVRALVARSAVMPEIRAEQGYG